MFMGAFLNYIKAKGKKKCLLLGVSKSHLKYSHT